LRIPLTPHGAPEMSLAAVAALAGGAVLWALPAPWHWLALIAPLGFLYVLAFFRDPERRPEVEPPPAGALLAPADGRVDFIGEADEPLLGGRCQKVSIFLSVFDVHLNRAPLGGRIAKIEYRKGEYLDARRDDCSARNEANVVVLAGRAPDGTEVPVLLRQVSGAIARRIVCAVREGQELAAGERFGMIKFGSRTDICVPAGRKLEVRVRLGQHVAAGRTLLGVVS
jgi:phosphatidylserine decarboxylase